MTTEAASIVSLPAHLLSIPRLARLGSSFSLFTRLPSLAGRVRSGKATEVSRTRRYAERRGRMRREEEPNRRTPGNIIIKTTYDISLDFQDSLLPLGFF